MPLCTECGTRVFSTEGVCPRCRHPRWYTLRKVAICFAILNAVREIAEHLKVDIAPDPEREVFAKDTPVESIARDLRSKEEEQS
jgi:hypothetical protein